MQLDWPILSVLVWLPVAAGVLLLLVGDRNAPLARWLALAAAVATFVVSLVLWQEFDTTTAAMQFAERQPWIGAFNAWYHLGVDGISMPLIVLTAFITPLVVIAGWNVIEKRPAQYFAAFLILEGLMIGVFAALDAMLFYVLWEAMLIPMFLIIGVWGGQRRVYATVKFFLYTFLGSVLMLVALIYMYLQGGSYSIADLQALPLSMREQVLIFSAFLIAFAVKVPMWPVHTWLPDAHVEAPTGSVILAAIMLKMGGYGFLRFSLPIAPDASRELDWLIITLSLTAVVYIGFVALVQQDMKKLIAYSSISHMGFVTLGAFIAFEIVRATGQVQGAAMGLDGAMVQMISHGLVSGALFRAAHDRAAANRAYAVSSTDAHLRRLHGAVLDGQLRPARNLRLRRRVPGGAGRVQGELLVRRPGRHHADPGRRLHAVAGQARHLRQGGQPPCSRNEGRGRP
jgi:NADH-quinone oxidoreductase subunit M